MDLSNVSEKALKAELERREKEKTNHQEGLKRIQKWQKSPIGLWQVKTEGDCEGRTVTNLGVHEGHVVDIAYKLSGRCYYSLNFTPEKTEPELEAMPPRKSVSIQLDIKSGTWDMQGETRKKATEAWLRSKDSKTLFSVEGGQYYASTHIKFAE